MLGAAFQVNSTKPYVPVVTFSINTNIKFLENLKQGLKIAISRNYFRSKITIKLRNNKSIYMIASTAVLDRAT